MNHYSLSHLSNGALQQGLAGHLSTHRTSTAWLLAHLAEFDERGLFAPAAHPSMHSYCVSVLRMSEDEASRRITAARTARQFPVIFEMVADGRLHLTAVVLLAPRLKERPDGANDLLAACAHKSRCELERLIAARFPAPDLPDAVTPAPPVLGETLDEGSSAPARMPFSGIVRPTSCEQARVAPLSSGTYGIQYTFDQEDYDLLQYAKSLLSHRVPSGSVREISRLALIALIEKTEKQMFGAGRQYGRRQGAHPRHIPRAVKQVVWRRDEGRCTFVGANGERCPARERLHFDHIHPVGRGGESSPDNLRLLCQVHNQFEADRAYGTGFMKGKRETARQTRVQASGTARAPAPLETLRLENDEAEGVEDSVAALRSLGFRERDAREAIARAGLPHDATVEQHIRAALTHRVAPMLARSERIVAAQRRALGVRPDTPGLTSG